MINTLTSPYQFLLLLLLLSQSQVLVISSFIKPNGLIRCLAKERLALLKFDSELIDDYGRLSTWKNQQDCCQWTGIRCDNGTNHVVSVDLHGPWTDNFSLYTPLRGNMSSSLLVLIDLSNNDFSTIQIPSYFGSLHKLQYLNLSHSNFLSPIPHNLGNLSMLKVLDLGGNEITTIDLNWLSGFSSLQYLDLNRISLENVTTWLHVIHKLTTLRTVKLKGCDIQEPSSFPLINSSANSLSVLDLSGNNLEKVTILLWFLNISTSYTYIDLSFNDLAGEFPYALTNLVLLSYLDLSVNKIEGRIPVSLGNMKSLAYLDLSGNRLEGVLPDSLGNMVSLSHLDLSRNNLEGGLPQIQGNLSNLVSLDLSENKFDGDIIHLTEFLGESNKLEYLDLIANTFHGSIPPISRFSSLKVLSLGRNKLNGSFVETKLILPHLLILDVTQNRLTGSLPDLKSCSSLETLFLSENMFDGTLTESIGYLSNLDSLYLHFNKLEGIVSEAHFFNLSHLEIMDFSFNSNLTISISSFWNPPFQLGTLKLAHCNLGPNFPNWLQKQRLLTHLDISDSQIIDTVPNWFWNLSHTLDYLNMSHNHVHGELPDLRSNFVFSNLDLSSNEFTGSLPLLSTAMTFLDLPRNRFSGGIADFCNTTYGRIVLDLSQNLLSGEISVDCFKNLMTQYYLDLGNNNFSGEIPTVNGWYCAISSLHLRNNSFTGQLPTTLRDCSRLQILDLGHANSRAISQHG